MSHLAVRRAGILPAAFVLLCMHPVFAATPGARAVERLKEGLRKEYGEVELMAGTMYEHGVCVKRDWPRAVPFYVRAVEHGVREAADRLAAGYADPLNGPDMAAALWWATRGRRFPPASLGISEGAAADPDRFVAELRSWAPERLVRYTYVVGVLSTVISELRYPELAQRYGLGGEVLVRFFPAVPRIEVRSGERHEYQLLGVYNVNVLRDRRARPVNNAFETLVEEIAARALKRYPQPPGLLPEEVVEARFIFFLEDE